MDHIYLYCVAGGIAMVLFSCAARIAFRWIVRLTIVGLLLLGVAGGAAWWWLSYSKPTVNAKPRPASMSGRTSSNRR